MVGVEVELEQVEVEMKVKHMIQVQLVDYCLVLVVAAVLVELAFKVELVVLEVELFCFTQRRSSSMVPSQLMVTMEANLTTLGD